ARAAGDAARADRAPGACPPRGLAAGRSGDLRERRPQGGAPARLGPERLAGRGRAPSARLGRRAPRAVRPPAREEATLAVGPDGASEVADEEAKVFRHVSPDAHLAPRAFGTVRIHDGRLGDAKRAEPAELDEQLDVREEAARLDEPAAIALEGLLQQRCSVAAVEERVVFHRTQPAIPLHDQVRAEAPHVATQ